MADQDKSGHRQRLRERFVSGEERAYTDEALLELLLSYAIPQKDVQALAQKLVTSFGDLRGVLAADLEMLCQFEGIKSNSAVLLKLTDWIRSHYQPIGDKQPSTLQPEAKQTTLFGDLKFKRGLAAEKPQTKPRRPMPPRRGTEMFANAVLKESIELLPTLPDTDSLIEIREYLRGRLHFNAEQTRQRYANYIIRRMFPDGHADRGLRTFAQSFRDSQNLRDVAFYRFLKAEPLLIQVVEELLLPSLGNGRVNRDKIKSYLTVRFPSSRSVKDCAQALVDALGAGGVARVDRVKIIFGYRDILLPAFAFVLHSEFPEPGMHDIGKLENNRAICAMLWNPDRILPSLYELRNRGLISKVSEIDNLRQFTTKYFLEEIVERLTASI